MVEQFLIWFLGPHVSAFVGVFGLVIAFAAGIAHLCSGEDDF